MHHYSQGKPLRQAHKAIPEGSFEEEQGLLGFFGPASHLVRKKPSTRWVEIDGPLKPRMYDLVKKFSKTRFQRVLYNSDVNIFMHSLPVDSTQKKECFRSADGDLIYFCHKGEGQIFTEYGLLDYNPGQYVVIPKCITHSLVALKDSQFFVVENKSSHYTEPDRGLVGRHAIYDIETIGKPRLEEQNSLISDVNSEFVNVTVKHNEATTVFKYDECVYDVLSWKGDLFPFTLHMDDMMPLMSHRAHLPPSAHTTFVGREFVICTFLPRPLESDKDALKVPFYHSNIDYDEVLFYHDGDFFSRDNLHPGMMSFHPAGFPHGPHPKAVKSIETKTHTSEYAVMVDTRKPLIQDEFLASMELDEYWKSWSK